MTTTAQVRPMELLTMTHECGLCMENTSRLLPCSHSFCMACLRQVLRSQPMSDSFCCPICRSPTDIPPRGIEDWKTGFSWTLDNEPIQAQRCVEKVCGRSQKNKQFVDNQPGNKNGQSCDDKETRERVCSSHPEEILRFYCTFCSTPICRDCKMTSHEGHPATNLNKKSAEAKTVISVVTQISQNNLLPRLQQMLEEAEKHKKRLQENKRKILSELELRAEELKAAIDQELSRAKEQLNQETSYVEKIVSTCADEMAHGMASLLSLTDHAQTLANKGGNADVVEVIQKMQKFFADAEKPGLEEEDFEILDAHGVAGNPDCVPEGSLKPYLTDKWRKTVQLDRDTEMKQCLFCSFRYFSKAPACPVCRSSPKTQRKKFGLKWKKAPSVSTPTPNLLCTNCRQTYDMSCVFCPGCGTPSSQHLLDTIRSALPQYIGHVSHAHQSASEESEVSACRQGRVMAGNGAGRNGGQCALSGSSVSSSTRCGNEASEIYNTISTIHFLLQEWN